MKKNANMRGFLTVTLLTGLFILLILDTEGVLSSGQKAVELCLNVIIPSLLPFFIVSRLIMNTGAIRIISRLSAPVVKPLFNLPGAASFPIIAGWFSGYPAGAKYTADLYKKGLLTRPQAERLLCFCNNSGPLFIAGAVGTGYFNSPQLGLVLLACHISASFTVGILQRIIFKDDPEKKDKTKSQLPVRIEFSSRMLTDAIVDSMSVLLQICGTIVFFAVLVQAIETAGVFSVINKPAGLITGVNISDYIEALTTGCLEITYGLFLLSRSATIPVYHKIILSSFLCGFGGFSVFTQVTFFCPEKIKLGKYLCGKLIHGFVASVYTALFIKNLSIPVMTYTGEIYNTGFSKGIILPGYIVLLALLVMYYIILHCRGSYLRRH